MRRLTGRKVADEEFLLCNRCLSDHDDAHRMLFNAMRTIAGKAPVVFRAQRFMRGGPPENVKHHPYGAGPRRA